MTDVGELHRKAMLLAEEATLRRLRGEDPTDLLRRALSVEREAALSVAQELTLEPTRSVLLRSAASIALECGEVREAERLVAIGLTGDPPAEIAEELRDILEKVNFQRHLELRGVELGSHQIQLSLTGEAVGLGIARSNQVLHRINQFESLLFRTAERLLGRAYRETGRRIKKIEQGLEVFISVPREASFAVSFLVGATEQLSLPNVGLAENVVEEVLDLLEIYNRADVYALRSRVSEEAYLRNFVALVRALAPDGRMIKTVGLTAARKGAPRRIVLTSSRDQVAESSWVTSDSHAGDWLSIEGELRFADEIGRKKEIKLVDANGKAHTVVVPEGMMADIVRPMWGNRVLVRGWRKDKTVQLEQVEKLEE